MKKLVLFLILLLAVESYGVYGRHQADRITYTCRTEVGPLCFRWEKNALGKLIGDEDSAELEAKLEAARKAWEEDFVQRLTEGAEKKSSLERALGNMKQALEDAGRAVRDAFDK